MIDYRVARCSTVMYYSTYMVNFKPHFPPPSLIIHPPHTHRSSSISLFTSISCFFFLPNSSLRLRAVIKSPGDASGVTNITISICAPGSEQASWQRRKLLVGKGLRESGVSIGVTDEVAKEGL